MSDLLAALRTALGNRYRIDRELTGGGMSRVFVAEELALGRMVVLKVLPPDAAATVNADRFRREVQFAAKLQHPHIVPVLATGEDAETLWYSMPFIEGDTLRGRLAKGPMELREALTHWQHMLDALAHAHKAGIVHRDMKPDNVLVSGRNALVTDFGIAKAVASATAGAAASGLTGVGFVVGTPAYMAPEQAAGMDAVDARTDLYSTALVAYEMLTGKAAFGGLTPPQTLAAQVQTMPEAPRTVNPDIPPAVEALLMQCLAKDPKERPASADVVCDALDAIVRGVGTPSRETAATPRRDGGRGLKLGAMIGMAIALGVIFWPKKRTEAPVERDLVVLASFAHEPKDSSVARALSEAFRIDLQQSPRLRIADPQLIRTTLQTMRLDPAVVITDSIAQALGTRLGAKAFVTGALSSLGSAYVLTARLVSVVDGTEVAALREDAKTPGKLLDATDRLSKALREKAGESVASLRASPGLPAATTSSLEALEHYAAGVGLMREGKQLNALLEYEKAVQLDSTFASAWSGMSTALSNMGVRPGDRLRAAERAFSLRERLPEIERLKIESRYYSSRGETVKEAAALQRILTIDPNVYAVLNNYGRLMFAQKKYALAESLFKEAIRVQPGALVPTDMLIGVAVESNNQRLLDSIRRAISRDSLDANVRLRMSLIQNESVGAADYPRFAKVLDSMLAQNPDIDMQGYLLQSRMPLYFAEGRISGAQQTFDRVIKPIAATVDPSLVANVQIDLAQARMRLLGDRSAALRLLASADSFYAKQPDPSDRALLDRAWAHAIVGNPATSRRLLAEMSVVLPSDSLFRQFVEGEIALSEGNATRAVERITPTIGKELFCSVCGLGALARAYDAAGNKDSVLAVYARLIDSRVTNGRMEEDAFERAQALKRSGELLEERGDTKGALNRYRQFIYLWERADPELQPIVKEVRDRIARIERTRG